MPSHQDVTTGSHNSDFCQFYCQSQQSPTTSVLPPNQDDQCINCFHLQGEIHEIPPPSIKFSSDNHAKSFQVVNLHLHVHAWPSKEAELHVLRMIKDGEIFATINQKDGMVSFNEDQEQYKTCQMVERLDSSIQRVMALSKKLSTIGEQIYCDPVYVTKGGRERARFDFDDFDSVPHKFL